MTERAQISPPAFRTLVVVALVFVTAIIVTGASVRLSGSGLGCPTWPRCTGSDLIDISEPHRAVEQINRLFTGVVGLAVIIVFAAAFRRRPFRGDLAWFGAALIGGVLMQGIVGGVVVLLELQWQAVVLHFLASFVLVYGNLELLRRAGEPSKFRHAVVSPSLRRLTETVFGVCLAVIALGTLVTAAGPHGGDADVARLDWPVRSAVQVHSVAVWILTAATIVLIVNAKRAGAATTFDRAGWLLGALIFQGSVGYLQWFNRVPPVLVAVHVFGAAVVFGLATWLRFGSYLAIEPNDEALA